MRLGINLKIIKKRCRLRRFHVGAARRNPPVVYAKNLPELTLLTIAEPQSCYAEDSLFPDCATVKSLERATSKPPLLRRPQLTASPETLAIESRRYIGNKAKLAGWIMDLLARHTEKVMAFADIFAGTGAVANRALAQFPRVIVNDLLYANQIIYQGFFAAGKWDIEKLRDIVAGYNALNSAALAENYFSENFGDKFFARDLAKIIGFIRQDLDYRRASLTVKEFNVLIASLIYSIDRLANTVGHFDAYIKKPIEQRSLNLRLIDAREFSQVEIHRRDANELAPEICADLVYIDPPYNSRQYSRFYHVYETLVKWDKPQLFGVALKPPLENMSDYCTVKAAAKLADLTGKLRARYLAVSYNNTYNAKSGSSENRIRLEEIERILQQRGATQVFEVPHKCFTTGKTEFDDHKEFLFITHAD